MRTSLRVEGCCPPYRPRAIRAELSKRFPPVLPGRPGSRQAGPTPSRAFWHARWDGKLDGEKRALAWFCFEPDGAPMLVHDHRMGDGKALPGALPHALGREEGI